MYLFDFNKRSYNPMNKLVDDLCFTISLYRKAAFQSSDKYVASVLLGMADFREGVLAQLRPYASVWEDSPASRQQMIDEQNEKVASMIVEIESDRDWFMVCQIEGKTVELIEEARSKCSNALVCSLLEKLRIEFESKLEGLLAETETAEKVVA